MRLLQILIASLLPVLLSGCLLLAAGAAGAVGYHKYKENEAYQDYKASPERTWKVTLNALEKTGYPAPAIKSHSEKDGGEIEDDELWVKVEARANGYTRVRVRVGTFETDEHRRKAGLILEEIEKGM